MKTFPVDTAFSLFIRARDNWACRRCGSGFKPFKIGGDNRHLKGLHNMHYFSRGNWTTRVDEDNCMAGCYGCHRHLDTHPLEKEAFWIQEIGQERFDTLTKRTYKAVPGIKKKVLGRAKEFRIKFREVLDSTA